MNQFHQVMLEIAYIQQLKNKKNYPQYFNFKILIINRLLRISEFYKQLEFHLGMAIANCLGSSSNFSITNKHRMMGEHLR
ncbi:MULTISPECIES: hypothetical protein [Acinetobacter]|jgi:hypothetical protein|uniref:hypothetical protein n=1 Tax=Acinetobacter TaxID=469 RepID=UPI00141A6839|nr:MULTISPECIES: hypothetical protein [Acinetobacter]MCS4299342.1 hypothetical protein [Acinetobacter guillouiae]MCW2252814.1 hypothetical protein [Acinetobacter sp. BIGb0204]MDO6643316.1 hypothetical protein [Acinetobacter guillouiae]NII35115.1 hypothetical protein [Acinetobacter sp. BIGb0196]